MLVNEDREDFLVRIEEALTNTKIKNIDFGVIKQERFDQELAFRQFITSKYLGLGFKKAILYCLGAKSVFRYPLPEEWLEIIASKGIRVDRVSSKFLWKFQSFLHLLKGVVYSIFKLNKVFFQKP